MQRFAKSFTTQADLPSKALRAAHNVLSSANLHRYQAQDDEAFEVAALEEEFAAWQGATYCLAVTSGGQAIQLAARALGVAHDEPVLTNAFTLAPVPGAIRAVGGLPVLVDTTPDLVIDLDDLGTKARESGARVLVLSHMRGHLVDMDALLRVAQDCGLTVIEDCAHTMGATWDGVKSGNFGRISCFSTQTYKHMNSGEGGFITSNDPELMARATVMSGSYMNFDRHGAAPAMEYFHQTPYDCPNMSARMDALRAAILRPQLDRLDHSIAKWAKLASAFCEVAETCAPIVLPRAPDAARRVGSSVQFRIPLFSAAQCEAVCARCAEMGVELKWFGRPTPDRYTSTHTHWRYLGPTLLPKTDEILATLFDLRLPLTFDEDDCRQLAALIIEAVTHVQSDIAA